MIAKTKRRYGALGAVGLAVTMTGAAGAGDVTFDFTGTGQGQKIGFSYKGGDAQQVFAGQLQWEVTATDSGLGDQLFNVGDTVTTFCTDIFDYAHDAAFTIDDLADVPDGSSGPMGETKASMVEHLYATHYADAVGASATNAMAAAFQVAIWEIVNEDESSLTSVGGDLDVGDFRVTSMTSTAKALASAWLDELFNAFQADGLQSIRLGALGSDDWQDQIFLITIPAPAPFGLALAGLLGVAASRRRETRRRA